MNYPPPIQRLIDHFRTLPGVGPKTAARFAMALLQRTEDELRAFGHALVDLKNSTRFCAQCLNLTIQSPCPICANPGRDKSIICVVARPQDLLALESTGEYRGLYHVLHGTLNPIEGITPAQLKIKELLGRIQRTLSPSPLAGDFPPTVSSPLAGEGGGEGDATRGVIILPVSGIDDVVDSPRRIRPATSISAGRHNGLRGNMATTPCALGRRDASLPALSKAVCQLARVALIAASASARVGPDGVGGISAA